MIRSKGLPAAVLVCASAIQPALAAWDSDNIVWGTALPRGRLF